MSACNAQRAGGLPEGKPPGSWAPIRASEKQREQTRRPSVLPARLIQTAAVLEAVKARPGNVAVRLNIKATAGLDSFCARRRSKSTVGMEESLRRGRTKESTKQERKRLRSWRRLENEETGFQIRTKKLTKEKDAPPCRNALTKKAPYKGHPPVLTSPNPLSTLQKQLD